MSEESYMMRDDAEDKSTAIGEEGKKREWSTSVCHFGPEIKAERGFLLYTSRSTHT